MRSIYGPEGDAGISDVCGSSGGSALSVALGLAAFALGTQTGVSIVCPAGRAGVVGFKPGRGGMMPMKGVIPISKTLDVVGPITRTVEDAETVWRVIKHPNEEEDGLRRKGGRVRVGVPRKVFWDRLDDMPHITSTLSRLVDSLSLDPRFPIVDKEVPNIFTMTANSTFDLISIITSHELQLGINHYLTSFTFPTPGSMRSLSDIIAYNLDHPDLELPPGPFPSHGHPPRPDESYADQSFLLKSDSIEIVGSENSTYVDARSEIERIGWSEGLESYFDDEVEVMLVPTEGVAGSLASLARVPMFTRSSPSLPRSSSISDESYSSSILPTLRLPSS